MINEVPTRFGQDRQFAQRQRGFTLVELLVVIGLILMLAGILLPAARKSIEAGRQVTCLDHLRQIAQATLLYASDNGEQFPAMSGLEPDQGGPLINEWIYAEWQYPQAPFNDITKSLILHYLSNRDPAVLRCPSDDIDSHPLQPWHPEYGVYRYSYVVNEWTCQWGKWWPRYQFRETYNIFPAFRLTDVRNPSQTIFFLEEDPRFIDDGTMMIEPFLSPTPSNPGMTYVEPPSYVHDVYRDEGDLQSRANVVFCDGHGEFVTYSFIIDPAHYNPVH